MIAIGSAALLLTILVVAVLLVVSVTQTAYGRGLVRDALTARIGAAAYGKWYFGKISGGFFTGFQMDSIEIRDAKDSLFLASGPLRVDYDIRDLIDRRILLRRLELTRPIINLTQYSRSEWNFDSLFRKTAASGPVKIDRGYDDFIRAENLVIHDGTLTLRQPWRPDPTLVGARRDSAITVNLARKDVEIVRSGSGFQRVRRFDDLNAETVLRWAHPDSAGQLFNVSSLDFRTYDPPLDVSDAEGTVLIIADSAWINARDFRLPHSRGSLAGKITNGADGAPTRYALKIRSDSVGLGDINWVYRPLPTEGRGSVVIDIRNNAVDPRIMEYQLSSMDLNTTGSRLRGGMTFGVGAPVLSITDVDLNATPLDFRLVEHLGGAPFPQPWKGQFNGTTRGKGGPLDRFLVEQLEFTFLDNNVPLALSSGNGSGELDITDPSETIFRGFDLNFTHLDLRTIEFLFPMFPRHGGSVSGGAHLDSLWHDVRFSHADFELRRGAATPSHFLGHGRITNASPQIIYDLNLVAQPISFDALNQAFPGFPLRGQMSGPIVAKGTLDALDVDAQLSGASGSFSWKGIVDDAAPGYAMNGRGSASALDVKSLLGRADLPATRLTGTLEGMLSGDSLGNLKGNLIVRTQPSSVEQLRITSSHLGLRFDNGRVYFDSTSVRTSTGSFSAVGGSLGLTSAATSNRGDSTRFRLVLDTLGALPGFLAKIASLARPAAAAASYDSLSGRIALDGYLGGSLTNLTLRGGLDGTQLYYGGIGGVRTNGEITISNAFSPSRNVALSFNLDSARFLGVALSRVRAALTLDSGVRSGFRVEGSTHDGAHVLLKGSSAKSGEATRILLDSLRLDLSSNVYNLASQGGLTEVAGGYTIENLDLRGRGGARVFASGAIPATGMMNLRVSADRLPVADVERMARVRTSFDGTAKLELGVTGTRESPVLDLTATVDSAGVADVRLERVVATARYQNKRLSADIGLFHKGVRAVSIFAEAPIDLTPSRVATRIPDEPISGRITANGVELSVIEAFFPQVRETQGKFTSNLSIAGTWKKPRLVGALDVKDGSAFLPGLGLQLRSMNADIAFTGDSAIFKRFSSAYQDGPVGDTLSVSGHVALLDYANPELNLRFFAQNFRIVNLTRVAELYINSALQLSGRLSGSTLSGFVNVDKGSLFIPELAQKRLIALRDIDSTLLANRDFAPPVPSALLQSLELQNVRVAVGDQVWLRSTEGASTSIQLGGEVSMTSVRVPRTSLGGGRVVRSGNARPDSVYRLALEGTLNADRGDYRLDAGVVQRKFQVEQGGTVTFFGEPELNPTLNISAIHTVRRISGQDAGRDIRIRLRLTGSLSNYGISFESVDGLDLSTSDLISYLVTGAPSFELGAASNENLRTAFGILLPSLGAFLGDRVAGGRFEKFSLELSPLGENERLSDLGALLKRTNVGVGKQLGSRTFLSANTNLCQLGGLLQGQSATTEDLIQSFGWTLEQRLNYNFSMALSAQPSTAALRCAPAGSSARGLISAPPQLGLDFFKVWRW